MLSSSASTCRCGGGSLPSHEVTTLQPCTPAGVGACCFVIAVALFLSSHMAVFARCVVSAASNAAVTVMIASASLPPFPTPQASVGCCISMIVPTRPCQCQGSIPPSRTTTIPPPCRCNRHPPHQVLCRPSYVPYCIVRSPMLVDCSLSGAVIAVGLSLVSRRTTVHRPQLVAVVIIRHSLSSLLPAQAHRRHTPLDGR